MTPPRRRSLMQRATIVLGLLLPGFDQVSDAFVFLAPTQARATCAGSTAPPASSGGAAVRSAVGSSYLTNHADSVERRVEGLHRQRYRGQSKRTWASVQDGMGAAESGGPGQAFDGDGDMGMAPVDMEQAMGSFSPEWSNDTARADPKEHLIKGSVIAADQTAFPYPIENFPPLTNSEVYYNGTSERFWWNQNSEAVCVYVPVPEGFDPQTVEFVAKTKQVSLKFGGEEVLSGTLFYRIDGYESLFVVDSQNDPPYVQLDLFKVREYQNWEDLIIEYSSFTPGGAQ